MAVVKNEHQASPYIVLDFETGGTDKKKSAITEIAMLAIKGDTLEEIGRYQTLVKPYGKEYHPKAIEVTGLTVEKLEAEGKPIEVVSLEVAEFMRKANVHQSTTGFKPIIVAHNSLFETGFLQHLQNEFKVPIDKLLHGQEDYYGNFIPSTVDTMHLAKFLWAANVRQKKYTLEATMERAGISLTDAHRAMNDVIPSVDFLKWVIKILRSGENNNSAQQQKELSFRVGFQF